MSSVMLVSTCYYKNIFPKVFETFFKYGYKEYLYFYKTMIDRVTTISTFIVTNNTKFWLSYIIVVHVSSPRTKI